MSSESVLRRFQAATWTYTGVFLTEASHNLLLDWWKDTTGIPLLDKVYAHHMTIKFKPSQEEIDALDIGAQAKLEIIGWASDEKGQAVLVKSSVKSDNRHPHITVACARGISPVYSNTLLAHGVPTEKGPTLNGIITGQ